MAPYRIVLADDHVLVRQGIKRIIQEDVNLAVTGEAGDGLELLDLLKNGVPDVVILDISMPKLRGLEATKRIKENHPGVKVLILTMHKDKEFFRKAMSNGADGYLLKEDADVALHAAIRTIRTGGTFVSPLLTS